MQIPREDIQCRSWRAPTECRAANIQLALTSCMAIVVTIWARTQNPEDKSRLSELAEKNH